MRTPSLSTKRARISGLALALVCLPLVVLSVNPDDAHASTPSSTTLTPPPESGPHQGVETATYTGTIPLTGAADPTVPCSAAICDTHGLVMKVPADYWKTHSGDVKLVTSWSDDGVSDLDITVVDQNGTTVGSAATSDDPEVMDLGQLAPGTYEVHTASYTATPGIQFKGVVTFTSTKLTKGMTLPENKSTLMKQLTIDYPVRVAFFGRKVTKKQVADLKTGIPQEYQPTVANVAGSTSPDADFDAAGAPSLVNWNTVHFSSTNNPYFLGMRYRYHFEALQASDAYTKAVYAVAKAHTAYDQSYHDTVMTAQQTQYDQQFGKFRVKDLGAGARVTNPAVEDLIDAEAVEDWIFKTRTQKRWRCAYKNVVTGKCVSAAVVQNSPHAYHDPYYDLHGLNLDKMPQGVNKGSSTLVFDTFTSKLARTYFRPNTYHVWGVDKVIHHKIISKPVGKGGSWRITDPDTGSWAGVDFARSWGGRYRFHFVDLGAAPNNYEDLTWLNEGVAESNAYPMGDPPIWEYDANPIWQQKTPKCADLAGTHYTGDVPCRLMPRIARDVAYQLFFRSTAGYLYRPIPQGDTNWLATSNFTDFYSRPQWINGVLTGTPYGDWWSNLRQLYQADDENGKEKGHDDTLRWLSSSTPYMRWIGRVGQKVKLYDPKTNKPTGKTLDASPKFADLPAPEYHVEAAAAGGANVVPEPLYPGHHEFLTLKSGEKVDLTALQDVLEKGKMQGLTGAAPDDSVSTDIMRDYVDAHRAGLADLEPGLNTIPAVNVVFEKAYTWALPAIVGGIAIENKDGNAWGVLDNVNDRFKYGGANYPVYDPTINKDGDKVSLLPEHPKQKTGTGFSYTIEHEAAHNLGLSHPHDGSYGVDKCPKGDPNAGKWKCYWAGQGWVMDVSAAPTTYAMDYRPYEVEDQDNLQRGHVVEYLLGAQTSLQTELLDESAAGRTTPSHVFTSRYAHYKKYKAIAVRLFKHGDYLHAEYAARDAAIAAKGVKQTKKNTVTPRHVGIGQIFYFTIHPQTTAPAVGRPKGRKHHHTKHHHAA